MIRVSDVWDRTVDVLRGRAGIVAGIAFLTMVLPAIVVGALGSIVAFPAGAVALVPLIRLAVVALLILGVLAITAVATDPAVDRVQGLRIARQRLLPALGILAILVIALLMLAIPIIAIFATSGLAMNRSGTVDMSHVAPGANIGIALVTIVGAILALWVSARMAPLFAIVVNERQGWRALQRSLALTRGTTMRLMGVLILYFLVLGIVMLAASSVVGVIARLLLGADAVGAVQFVLATVGALISAAATVVQSVFYARFYVAAVEHEQRMAPLT